MDFSSPWFWAAAAGLAAGFVIGSLLPRRADKKRSRPGGVAASLWAAAAVVLATCGVFLSDLTLLSMPGILVCAGCAIIIGAASYRFPLFVGIPLVILLSLVYFAVRLSLQPWLPVRADSGIGTVRIISVGPGSTELEWTVGQTGGEFRTLPSGRLSAAVDLLEPPEWAFFCHSRFFVSNLTLRSSGGAAPETPQTPQATDPLPLTPPPDSITRLFASAAPSLPGFRTGKLESAWAAPAPLRTYAVRFVSPPAILLDQVME